MLNGLTLRLTAFAEADAGAWESAVTGVKGLYGSMARLMIYAMLLGAMVVLVMIVLKLMNGEKEAAAKLLWWFIGLVFGLTMISILRGLKF